MIEAIEQLAEEVAELRRRVSQMHQRGRVHQVSPDGGRYRIRLGYDPEGNPILSPWVRMPGANGALSTSFPLTVGEHVFVMSPDGDWEQAEIIRSNHHNEGPRPSNKPSEHVIKFGASTLTLDGAGVLFDTPMFKVKAGGVTYLFDGSGFEQTGGKHGHDGKDIGKTHTHPGIVRGGASTDPPNPE